MSSTGSQPASDAEVQVQRSYYQETAQKYDELHVHERDEHYFALKILEAMIDFHGIRSVLDVGAGTGRVARYFRQARPDLKVVSIEPVDALREIGHAKGLSHEELLDGDVNSLAFADGAFDLVCEFGVLHHVKRPSRAVAEMLRVARVAIFISDCNNFGQGSRASRLVKQLLNAVGMWRMADLVKTGFKGYTISEGDGLAYSYSVFNDYDLIRSVCDTHIINTRPAGIDPYRTAEHVALLGVKRHVARSGPSA